MKIVPCTGELPPSIACNKFRENERFSRFLAPESRRPKKPFSTMRAIATFSFTKNKSVLVLLLLLLLHMTPKVLSGAPGAHQSLQLDELKRFMPSKKFRQKSIFPKIAILSRLVLLYINFFFGFFLPRQVEHSAILPVNFQISGKSIENIFKKLAKNRKKQALTNSPSFKSA